MALETATYLDSLVTTNPAGTDQLSTSDDHLRLLKACLQRTFPNIDGEVSATPAQINNAALGATSVSFAQSADYAISANWAASASYAISANHAASATGAVSAQFATSATNATSAVFATSATNATSAVFATSATNATSAVFATSATNATNATDANSASSAATLNGQAYTNSNFLVGNGSAYVAETGATARTSLGLGTGNSPQFTAVNIGHASDTTITRDAAGQIAVEGDAVFTHNSGTYTSAKITFQSGGSPSGGNNGDIVFIY